MGEYLFIVSGVFSIVNGTVLLCINPRRVVNKVFFATSAWIAVWLLCIALAIREGAQYNDSTSNAKVVFWVRCSTAAGAFLGWFTWLTRSALITNKISVWQVSKESWRWFTASALMALLAYSELYIPSSSTPSNKQYGIGYGIYVGVASVGCVWFLFDALRLIQVLKGIRKIEMQIFVLNLACACLLVICSNLIGIFLHLEWLKRLGPIWFLALHGVTIWALCYHRIFDAKHIILSIGQRLLLFGVVGSFAVLLEKMLGVAIGYPWNLAAVVSVACILVVVCDKPMRRWVGLDPSHLLLPARHRIIDWARELPDEEMLQEKFKMLLRERCQTSSVLFFSTHDTPFRPSWPRVDSDWSGFSLLCKDGGTTPETLQRSRISLGKSECMEVMSRYQLGALLAVPKGSASPSLIVGLGEKEGLRPYTFPELQGLLELAELMDNILIHSRVSAHAAKIERMESATMISRGLAHDLQNLATPVSAFLIHMENCVAAGTTEAIVLADAKASILVMQDYIEESLFFSRRLVLRLGWIESRHLLAATREVSQERARQRNVRVTISDTDNFRFVADFTLLQRMLQNLVFNGIDASEPGTFVNISAAVVEGKSVCLQVTDSGQGIDPAMRERIFEPYFTTKNIAGRRRGTGLGLSIGRKIAELHEGRITPSSNIPCGSVFTVVFPKTDELPSVPAEPEHTRQDAQSELRWHQGSTEAFNRA